MDGPLPSVLVGISTTLMLSMAVSLQHSLHGGSSRMRIAIESSSDLTVVDGDTAETYVSSLLAPRRASGSSFSLFLFPRRVQLSTPPAGRPVICFPSRSLLPRIPDVGKTLPILPGAWNR